MTLSARQKTARHAKQNRRVPRKGGRKPRQPKSAQPVLQLSAASAAYALALANPFVASRTLDSCPGIPDWKTIPSTRFATFAKFTMSTGTTGIGSIMFRSTCGSNHNAFEVTQATSIASIGTAPSSFTGLIHNQWNSPYLSTQFDSVGEGVFRMVGMAFKVTYMGTELNRGGVYLGLQRYDDIAAFPASSWETDPKAVIAPIGEKAHTFRYVPSHQEDYEYHSTNSTEHTARRMGIIIQGASGAPSNYFVESVAYWEAIGSALGQASPVQSDAVGLSAVSSAVQSHTIPAQHATHSGVLKSVANGASGMTRLVADAKSAGTAISGLYNSIRTGVTSAVEVLAPSAAVAA